MGKTHWKLSRRTVLKGATGLVIGVHLPFVSEKAGSAAAPKKLAPNAFVRIGTDDIVTVVVKHIELGQGPLTGLSTLVAEELDADWSQIRAEHAPSNAELYKNLAFGAQGTGGSTAIANSYTQMRKAGASARAMLVQAAANAWNVPASGITVDRGVLHHRGSGRSGRFGQFAAAAADLPVPVDAPLKDPSAFGLIGREGAVKRLDVPSKTNGTAKFTIDILEAGMLTVVVARPPRFGAQVASFDAVAARAVKGVVDVRQIDSGVAVYANGTWPAIKGRKLLSIVWDDSAAEKRGTAQLTAEFRALAQKSGTIAASHGDVEAALAEADKVIEAEFVFPYLAHAPMEPLDGYLRWNSEGAVARFGCQSQTLDQDEIARVLGLKPQKIQLETMLAGGSFGRRGQFGSHFAIELAQVAKALGPDRPVKLVWTREDDIRGGYYRPLFVHRLRGALRGSRIAAWDNTVVGQSFIKGTAFESRWIKGGVDRSMVEGARKLLYDIPDFRCDMHMVDAGVPVLWWRSVGHTHTGYAVECFVDELLQAAGQDPIAGRLAMMKKHSRAAAVLRAVAKIASWNGPGPRNGRAWGVAVVESFGTVVAQ
ncbi:MAG: xanthine dehydrogenase family protein molybdopterin-binding subunit, partial [Alphaproteobacteria bacterium]|nr:xanthine dehydrogenase family protein molybdopterin-binding subunit [Alphaproteobacteria bacterium]